MNLIKYRVQDFSPRYFNLINLEVGPENMNFYEAPLVIPISLLMGI